MRAAFMTISLLCGMYAPTLASAQISLGFNTPGLSIGINLPVYPDFAPVPGYPVYYAPQVDANLFFYDGMYWTYTDDNWYASSWYNGPWDLIQPELVPYFVLRVPILYYRRPPVYFQSWDRRQPPRWGEHWGSGWEQNHRDWDRWDHSRAPSRAPLPNYQRQYSRDRYPSAAEQRQLHQQNYRFQPRESVDRQLLRAAPARDQSPRQDRQPPNQRPVVTAPGASRPEGGRAAQPMRRAPIERPQQQQLRTQQRAQPMPQRAQPIPQRAQPMPQRAQPMPQRTRPGAQPSKGKDPGSPGGRPNHAGPNQPR